jgi:dihydroorotate dehydrogenase
MYRLLRPILFIFSPEQIHRIVLLLLWLMRYVPWGRAGARSLFCYRHKSLERTLWGLTFPNPVGLAAGFDKNAEHVDELACLGFGFVEVGSVTPLPQSGNPRPRLFRLPADSAIVNRMGFNNHGMARVASNLQRRRKSRVVVGANIGKNTATDNDRAPFDYEQCLAALYPHADYFVVNVSCPNVASLCQLQSGENLTAIAHRLTAYRATQAERKPILLKLSPDLSYAQLDEALAVVEAEGLDGVVATNTTTSRDQLRTPALRVESVGRGGLSGAPLTQRALEVVRYISRQTQGHLPIIGVGGIMTEQDALNMLAAGASLVQVYTGFIYGGPGVASRIAKSLKI